MSDLSSMIDATTERLLRKIDNWEVPQSDKKYVVIEKEVWESTLKASMDRAGKIETLQKQLDIAIDTLRCYGNPNNWDGNRFTNFFATWQLARNNLDKIEELNK